MARTSKKNKTITNKRPLPRSALVLVWTLGPILLLLGLVSYNSYLYQADRQRFETVKASVEALAKELQMANTLDNASWTARANCSRASEKYKQGDAVCGASAQAIFSISKAQDAKAIIDSIDQVASKSMLFKQQPSNKKIYPNFTTALDLPKYSDSSSDRYASRIYAEKATGMKCSMNYELLRKEYEKSGQPELIASFSCGGGARDTWFPRNDIQN